MAIITVPSATQGRSYNVKISGDAPTPTEQARIAQYVAEQDAASQARVEKYFGAQQQQAPAAPEKGGIAGLMTSLGRGYTQADQSLASAIEGVGESTGIDWLRDYGKAVVERDAASLAETEDQMTRLEDVSGVGSGLSYIGEGVGETATQTGIGVGAGILGGAIGTALLPGPGTVAGAAIGSTIGAAISQIPFFYGQNRERQKQEDVTAGRPVEIDEGTAALAAIPQAGLEGAFDAMIGGKLFPEVFVRSGKVLTRLAKGSVAGAVTEVPTEVGQQVIERYQAGLALDTPEAVEEYRQAMIGAIAVGGSIGGFASAVHGDAGAKKAAAEAEIKQRQLLEDDASMQKDYEATQIFAAQNEAELAKANALEPQTPEAPQEAPRMLPPPKAGEEPKLKVVPVVNPAAYTPEMRSRAVAFATSGKNFTLGEFHQHMNEVTKTNIPKQSIANLMADLKSERIIRTDYRTGSTSASRKFAPTKYAAQARERLDSFINESATLEAEAKSLSDVNDKLSADLRAAEQTGADLSGKKANTSAIGRQIDENTARIAEKLKRAADARAEAAKMPESLAPSPVERKGLPPGIKAAPLSQATPKAAAPRQEAIQQSLADNINAVKALASKKKSLSNRKLSSVEQVALDDTERKIAALKLRRAELLSQAKSPEAAIQDAQNQEAADNAKALSARVQAQRQAAANEQAQLQMVGAAQPASAPATAPVFDIKAQNVFGSLRGRLNKLGLGNVRLAAESTLGSKGEASGTYSAKQRLISLAMGIYDPKLSEQELLDRIARVMDHESIHALKSVGVFTDAEWASLTRAAKDMKYKAMKNGKLEERAYSYLDRAENMYDGVVPRADWGNTTIATDLISPQVLKALRKAAGKSKVKLGETVSLETISKLIGEQTATEVAKIEFAAEEAVAEMFGDYVQGRIKFAGKPKTLFERIKAFFRGLIGASIDNGITDAQSILDDIQSGAVGARQQAPITATGIERQSKMTSGVQPVRNVPEELKRLTVLDMMNPETGMFIQRDGKKITVIEALQELFDRRSDVVINQDDPGAAERVGELIALEAQMAVLRNPKAIGWYGKTLDLAKRVAAMEYPEISPVNPYSGEKSNSYSPLHEHIWDLATAITSNGQAVLDNFTHAAEQYEHWKVHGRFKEVGHGKQAVGIVAGLKFYNTMKDVGYSEQQIEEFLNEKMTVRDLKKHPVVVALGLDIGSGESVDTEVYGSYVLGPKIGQGFYQNLRGNFSPLTMDVWFTRLFNRITGKPFTTVTDETKLKNFERISRLAENPMLGDYEKGLLETAKEVAGVDIITPENVGDLAVAYNKLFQRDFTNTRIKEMKRLVSLGYDPKDDATKAMADAARPEKVEISKAMDRASQNFQESEQATPRNSSERTFMRDAIKVAQEKVLSATGVDVNTADFQALLWYAEKQLLKAMNVREGRGGDNDYVDGVIHFLRKKGISDEEISRVLPEGERDRLVSGTDSGRQDAGVLSGPEGSDSGQEDGSNQLLSQTPNGQRETAVARNGGVGRGAKPKRGVEAVAAAKVEDVERLSRMVAHAPQGKATPFTGQSDLMKHTDSLRYAAVQGAVSRLIQRTAGKYFKIDPKIIDDKTAGFFKKMQDDMIYVGKMYDSLRAKGIDIPQEYDSYFQDQLMRDTAGAKKQDFQEGFLRKIIETAVNAKFNSTNVDALDKAVRAATGAGSYISEIVKKVGNESHAIANAYLYALHAKERNQRIKEMSKGKDTQGSGMSDAEADAILNWVKTLPQSQQAALDNVDKLAQDIVWMTNDEYIQGGLIPVYNDDKATLDDGTEVDFPQYDNYVPLRGFTDLDSTEDKSEGGNGFGKFSGSVPNKSAAGRASYAGDILVNIGTQYEAAVDKAARNKVGQSMLELIENNAQEMSAIAFVLESHPLKKVVVDGTIRNVPDRDFSNDEKNLPILPVRRNGKEILIGFHDKNIADAMKGSVSASTPNAVFSTIHNITRIYANLLTSWNPAFVLGNLPRDIETAIFNSQQYEMKGSAGNIIKKVGPSIKAIWGVINDTGAGDPHLRMRYKQFYENGGQSVFNGMVNLSNSTASVQNIIKEVEGLDSGNALFKSKHFFTKTLLGKVEAANTAVENGTRLAFFDAMMTQLEKDGVPTKIAAKRAAYAAKNLTTNFTKGGEFRNGLNTAYLFYNASLQGSMAMMNSLVRSKKARKMAASIVIMGFVMDMLNAAASDDEDGDGILDYDNFNENRLTKYILIPDFTGTGTHISIPMAYGLNIFYNAGRTLSNYVRGVAGAKGTYTASEAAASTVGQAVSTLNPFGGNNMFSILSPTQTDLIVELMTNKDFKDQPIYKELSPFDQSKSRSNLYWSTTSPSAVFVSKFLNDTLGGGTDVIPGEILGQRMDIQPDVIEHVLGFLTGGLGSFLGASLDTATSTLPDAMSGKWSADMVGKTPVLNKFLTQVSEKDKAGDYYTNRDKVMVIQAEIKDAIAAGDGERIAAAKATYPERIKVMGRIGEIEKRLAKLRKMKRLVTDSTTMDEAKRQKSIDNINQAINKLMALGNQIMGDAGV